MSSPRCKKDTGWIDLKLEEGQAYIHGSVPMTPQVRRIGKIVQVRGIVNNIVGNFKTIAFLPEEFRPSVQHPYINDAFQSSNVINSLLIMTNGAILYNNTAENNGTGNRQAVATDKIVLDTNFLID